MIKNFSKLLTIAFLSYWVISAPAFSKTTVTWWNWGNEGSDLAVTITEDIQNRFNASQSEINLEISFKGEDVNEPTRTALLAGAGPDIVTSSGSTYVRAYYDGGFLKSMEEYSTKYGWNKQILPWAYNLGVFDGEFYSFPKNYESMVLFYNKTLFNENGWSLPTNLSEYETLAENIKAKGMYPFAYGSSGWQPTHEHLVGNYFNTFAGPDNVYKALVGEKKWTDSEFVEALELLKKHMLDGYWSGSLENYYATDWDGFSSQFINREAAMLPIGTWGFEIMAGFADKNDDWAVAPLPIIAEDGGTPNYQLSIGGTMSINAGSKNPDAAAKVIDWILRDKSRVLEFSAKRGYAEWLIPLAYEASDFAEGADPKVRDYLIDFAEVTGAGNYGYTTWTFYPAEAGTHIWKDMESVWAEDISVLEFLGEQQALWDKARAANKLIPVGKR
ncbi:MAG: hypothetical protein CBD02_02540 [Candidatus Pelagibacter sp. TMED142]|nr:MAG: hypothetical protein CBD02_02540 [Candidatus Pelagibacter sp. TMED142]